MLEKINTCKDTELIVRILGITTHVYGSRKSGTLFAAVSLFNQTVTPGGFNYGGTTMSLIKTRPGVAILLKHRLINLRFGELATLILL